MDLLGKFLWFLMFVTPLITMPIAWRRKEFKKGHRVLIGLFLVVLMSILLFILSMNILLRNGLGLG